MSISQVAFYTAQAIAAQAATDTGAFAAHVTCTVSEALGAHPAKLVYSIELIETGDTFEMVCSETTLEQLTEKMAECVAHSYEWQDSHVGAE